ncbi:MAG: mechanosensitive ion channel family protein [Myxococcota bacterium]
MNEELTLNLGTLLSLLVLAAALLVAVRGVRWGARLLPVSSSTRSTLLEAIPLVEICLGALYLLLAVERIFRGSPLFGGVAVVGVLFFGLWLGGETLRDVVAGVMLRAGGSVSLGDRVRVHGLEGRVSELGYRVVTLDLGGGDESLVPYSQLSRHAIVRTPHVFGAHRHVFRLPLAADPDRVRQMVLLSHWSSVSRPPILEVREGPDGPGLEVTVFALDPDQGPAIEGFVRRHSRSPS